MASFGIFGGSDPLKSIVKINTDATQFSAAVAQSEFKNVSSAFSAADVAQFSNVIPAGDKPFVARTAKDVANSAREAVAFLDSPEGKILQELEKLG